jgi:hypothetical protein
MSNRIFTASDADVAEAQSLFRTALQAKDWYEAADLLSWYTTTEKDQDAYPLDNYLADSDLEALLTTPILDLATEYDERNASN